MAGPEYVYSPYVRRGVYTREWADLRQRCAVEGLVIISGIVAFAGVGLFLSHFDYPEKYAVLVAVPWVPALIWASARVRAFRCPRCGQRYSSWLARGIPSRCRHCGLPYAEGSENKGD
jgi:hypothetical protein